MVRVRSGARGFTLVELMIVVAIIGVLASIAIPAFQYQMLKAKSAEAATNLAGIRSASISYHARHGYYVNIPNWTPPIPFTELGVKHPWPVEAPTNTFSPLLPSNFADLGFIPSGDVYFFYVCYNNAMNPAWEQGGMCSAFSDLDRNGNLQNWRFGLGGYFTVAPFFATTIEKVSAVNEF